MAFGKLQEKMIEKLGKDALEKMAKDMMTLENHMITIQKNQCEYEAYVKDILERLKRIEANQNSKK